MPNANAATRAAALPVLNQIAAAYNINNELRMAAWLATLAQESGELRYQEEIASGAAYEGRADLGNTQTGDGRKFKGRGRIQITGRFNYQAYTNYLASSNHIPAVNFIANPATLATEPYATDAAGWFWAIKISANPIADRGDFLTTQIRVNGRNRNTGLPNHWNERLAYYNKGKSVLPANFSVAAGAAPAVAAAPAESRILKSGMKGADVKAAQERLIVYAFLAPDGADGDYGTNTEAGVRAFQAANGLEVDGKIGHNTARVLGLE